MDSEVAQVFTYIKDLGTSGVLLVCVYLFLRDRKTMMEQWNAMIANHLDHASNAIKDSAHVMAAALDRLNESCRKRNGG